MEPFILSWLACVQAAAAQDMHHEPATADSSILSTNQARNASGTAWQPDTTPMHAWMGGRGRWSWMAHGNAFVFLDLQSSRQGDREFGSTNWFMGEAHYDTGTNQLGVRAMVSLEPLTIGGDGYPLPGQTGETWKGEPLLDRQHPHDIFMETALLFRQAISRDAGFELYVAPVGEPALGPVGFPHRMSAFHDPLAPLSHHWQDSTHISFGVMTAGVFTRAAKLEGSWFNGREPDENRYDFDLATPDSGSVRLTVNPLPSVSAQLSYGWLGSPEADHPGAVNRVTGSVSTFHPTPAGGVATTVAWGRNVSEEGPTTDAVLLESDAAVAPSVQVFGRAEYTRKGAEDLQVEHASRDAVYDLGSLSVGGVWLFFPRAPARLGVGIRGNLLVLPEALAERYGGRVAPGAVVFVQAYPAMSAGSHSMD